MKKIKSFLAKLFYIKINKESQQEKQYLGRLKITFDTLKFWTPELIEWINKEADPIKLSVTGYLINCHKWPEWLPSKPEQYNQRYIPDLNMAEYWLTIHFCVEVYKMMVDKADAISPGLPQKIWLTGYYKKYEIKEEQLN